MVSDIINVKIIIGSTRQSRFGEKPAAWIFEEAKKRDGIDADLIDLRDWPLPFYEEAQSPKALTGNYTSDIAKQWEGKVSEGDAFIIATPEYNHGYPAVLKNALDYVYTPWNTKPVGFVSWGHVGGARSVEQLRQVAIELKMVPIRSAVHIAGFLTLLDESGNVKEGAFDPFTEALGNLFTELLWYARPLKRARIDAPL